MIAPDTATMQRYDCPIHSGPLVVLESLLADCCRPGESYASIEVHRVGDQWFNLPFILPAECIRDRAAGYPPSCVSCGKVRHPRYATRPYVEEEVLS